MEQPTEPGEHEENNGQPNELPLEDERQPEPPPKREYVEPLYYKDKHKKRRVLLSALAIIVLIGLGGGVYVLKSHKNTPASTASSANQQAGNNTGSGQTQANSRAGGITTQTKHYDSSTFTLGLDYPADWAVADSAKKLTVTSPITQLTAADGQTVDGKIELQITPKGKNLAAFTDGSAIAALDSEKVSYTNPSPAQRAKTYLSFLRYAKDTTSGALDGVYITGDFGYQQGQAIPKTDIAKIEPEVAVIFIDSGSQPISIASSSWNDSAFSDPIKNLLLSLSIT